MYKKYICIGITIDNIILEESKTPKILNIVFALTLPRLDLILTFSSTYMRAGISRGDPAALLSH